MQQFKQIILEIAGPIGFTFNKAAYILRLVPQTNRPHKRFSQVVQGYWTDNYTGTQQF